MYLMKPSGTADFGANFTSITFDIDQLEYVNFAVSGLTAGKVTIEYSTDNESNWYDLDSDNLVFDFAVNGDAMKTARVGSCKVRAVGDASVAGADLAGRITGPAIRPTEAVTEL